MEGIDVEQEDDGRWIAEIVDSPGVMVYGTSRDDAIQRARNLADRLIGDRVQHGETSHLPN